MHWQSLPYLVLRRLSTTLLILISMAAVIIFSGCRRDDNSETTGITFITDPGAKTYQITEQLAREFEKTTGHRVRLIRGPSDATERLSQYLQYLGAESPDIDVYQVDVIWPATLENHLLNLTDHFSTTETAAFVPAIIKNNTINGRLLAIPYYVDVSLLYYRSDLLEKYGFDTPPGTWDDLTTVAERIQSAERKTGSADLWGFVWQGRAYEGLTCNALEWQVAEGGGRIVSPDGTIQVDTPAAVRAFDRAASWVGTISPPGVTMYSEEEARQMFQAGNAIFMRNWPYAFSLVNGEESPVAGKVKTAPLPAGASGTGASTLGGWQLGVSRYSAQKEASVEFVRFMTGTRAQKEQALQSSRLPTRLSLYDDPEIARKFPFIPTMRDSLESAVARPSSAAGADYNEVSTYYFQHVHRVLTGQESAEESMSHLHELLQKVLKP